jgi:tetratricopeptide (TPR) repeat protein
VISREHPFTVAIFAVAAAVASAAAFSQPELDAASNRQRQLVDSIEREVSHGGAYSELLIAPLSELALLFQEADDRALASATIERALQVVRANYGLYSLAQAPLISRLVANEAAAGNHETAWEIEDELLTLAKRHPEDLRTVAIFREIGDRRVRLSGDELPLSVVCKGHSNAAGCREGSNAFAAGSVGGLVNEFYVGSVRSLVNAGAMNNWGGAINVFLQNQLYDSQELRELEEKLIALGGCDVARESYRRLMYYDEASAETWLNRAATIVRAADSELVCSQIQRPALERAALELYREAYELLERNAVDQPSIDELFAPEVPIRLTESLPARAYLIPSVAPSDSSGHIDIAFEITKDGRARGIEIVDATPNCTDEEKHNFFRWVRDGLYRPRATNGAIADGSRVVWRYYWRDSFYDELYWGDRHFL